MQLWLQCLLRCPFFFSCLWLKLSLVAVAPLHNTPGKAASSLLLRHLTDIQAQAPILDTSPGMSVGCRGGATPLLPCRGLPFNAVLRRFCSCVFSRDHRSSWGLPLLQLPPRSHFPRSVPGWGFARLEGPRFARSWKILAKTRWQRATKLQ